MIRPLLVAATLTTWAVAVAPLQAQTTQPPCQDPAYRQFDFWLGSWDVFRPDGQKAGHNDITSEMGGCVLHEHYDGAGGYHGESFNTWDPGRGVWHQTWVDNGGTLLLIEGTFSEGHMRLEGTTVGLDGSTTLHRITWTQLDESGDRVRQLWEQSTDGGDSWAVAFDGEYRRVPG